MRIVALIMAAGSSRRMGENKLLLPMKNHTVIEETLSIFESCAEIDEIGLVTNDPLIKEKSNAFSKVKYIVAGGKERMDSVYQGLTKLKKDDFVLIHDAARPFLSKNALKRCIKAAKAGKSFTLAVPVKDTIKIVQDDIVQATPKRETLYQAQTPQGFLVSILLEAYERRDPDITYTDDSSLIELNQAVHVIEGEYSNIKITTIEDKEYL